MPDDLLTYKYWMEVIQRAEKAQPTDEWKLADDRLNCEVGTEEKLPYVNGYRLHYESLKSFLDQISPNFTVTPTEAYIEDQIVLKQSECDLKYLKYVWREQHMQIRQSQKLDSTLRFNFGGTVLVWDTKKWMPALKYTPASHILVDPDCHGILEAANWQGYYEWVDVEQFKADYPGLSDEDMAAIRKASESSLTEDEQKEVTGEADPLDPAIYDAYLAIKVYYIFAKNSPAIRNTDDEEPAENLPRNLDLLKSTTPRKCLKFVKGHHKPLETTAWPYELDDDEYPITILRFNTPGEKLYAFTDFKQMRRMEDLCESVMNDVEWDSYWSSVRKFTSSEVSDLTSDQLSDILRNHKRAHIPNLLDAEGKSKLVEIEIAKQNTGLDQRYAMLDKQRQTASGLGELMATEAHEYKDVTALAATIHDANVHQRVNRRLSGPEGYEESIRQDAVKILELAHQKVPQYSKLELQLPTMTSEGRIVTESRVIELPWDEAVALIKTRQATLLKLGVDAIVGPELAEYWRTTDEFPTKMFTLSTKVAVEPGSTRMVAREHQAAMMKQYFLEIFAPLYEATKRYDLYALFAARIGRKAGIDHVEDLLPKPDELQQFSQEQKQMEQAARQKELMT